YWDADNVFIERIESRYDADASSIGVERYMNGGVDKALVPPDKLAEYMQDSAMADEIHPSRPDSSFSYFYAFNFQPLFDQVYEPENWQKAVVNENFRKSLMAAINRQEALAIYEPYESAALINNTVTPPGAATNNGKDFTSYGELAEIAQGDSYDPDAAVKYKALAVPELEEAGVTFPIKVLMPYNPSTDGWRQEAYLIEEQIEGTLGQDYVDIIVEAGSDTGFLLSVRRSGKYAFMKCRWGADYADPQTWTEPFENDGEYMFWHECKDEGIVSLHSKWRKKVDEAEVITDDLNARFEAFAEAEALLIDHAVIVPFSIMSGDGYVMSKLNEFEGEYSSYGMARQRYKLFKLHETSMNMTDFEEAYNNWLESK
ncbi:MAG: peptide ABC transporter substrate-binding protein, partial [Pseudobutyrivibrio sp.]|nr:peptide ABC transporter substrate-binding protein [Pseudobutyrivibrio sp.]